MVPLRVRLFLNPCLYLFFSTVSEALLSNSLAVKEDFLAAISGLHKTAFRGFVWLECWDSNSFPTSTDVGGCGVRETTFGREERGCWLGWGVLFGVFSGRSSGSWFVIGTEDHGWVFGRCSLNDIKTAASRIHFSEGNWVSCASSFAGSNVCQLGSFWGFYTPKWFTQKYPMEVKFSLAIVLAISYLNKTNGLSGWGSGL